MDYELFPIQPSLYQDRAEACWYLAGILSLPHVVVATPNFPGSDDVGRSPLSIHDMLARLMTLSDQRGLDSRPPDFETTYRIVLELGPDCQHQSMPLGGLIYREPDSTRAGFED